MSGSSQESKQLKMEIGEPATFKLSEKTLSRGTLEYNIPDDDAEQKNSENTDMSVENCEYTESKEKSSSWSEICRVCANENSHVVPIFEGEGAEHDLCKKIHKYLPIQVSKDDTLPVQLCYQCTATILAWHELLEGCMEAEKRLVRMESELKEKEEMQLKYTEIPSSNGHAGIIIESEELVDDPEPIATHGEEHICSMEKLQEPSETVEHAPSQENEERSGKSKKPFKLFLDTQSVCRKSRRKVKIEVRDEKRATRDGSEATWRDVLYASIDHRLPSLESPERANEDLDCCVDEASTKAEETELASSLKIESTEREALALCGEDIVRRSEYPVYEESTPGDESGPEERDGGARCNVCSREFSQINDLHVHAKEHKDLPESRKIYQCVECAKSFRLKDSFVRHLRIHRDERPFTCHVCGKQFRDSGGLSRHLKDVHAKLKNFPCDICGKSFSSKATRDDHRRTHTGERPYVCDTCNKSFKSKACLYSHNKLHTNEFPHPCAYCSKKFRRRQEMLVHATTHTGEKNYSCDVCYKRFRVKTEVVRHKLTHSDEKPFVCAKCGLRFRQNRYLNNHIKTRHVQSSKD